MTATPPTAPIAPSGAHTRSSTRLRKPWRRTCARALDALRTAPDDGDVPGWVLVTLMTAGLVLAIWAVAGPALTDLFETAIERVASFGG